MRDLNNYVLKCKCMLDNLNIPYSKNIVSITSSNQLKKSYGNTRMSTHVDYSYSKIDDQVTYEYKIKIKSFLLDESCFTSDIPLVNTIIHELLHTCNCCMNHGYLWKYYANKVNAVYPDINIRQFVTAEEIACQTEESKKAEYENMHKNDKKYCVSCANCKIDWFYKSMSKVVKNPELYRCGKCKTALIRTK